jgi:hypothetical protein
MMPQPHHACHTCRSGLLGLQKWSRGCMYRSWPRMDTALTGCLPDTRYCKKDSHPTPIATPHPDTVAIPPGRGLLLCTCPRLLRCRHLHPCTPTTCDASPHLHRLFSSATCTAAVSFNCMRVRRSRMMMTATLRTRFRSQHSLRSCGRHRRHGRHRT